MELAGESGQKEEQASDLVSSVPSETGEAVDPSDS